MTTINDLASIDALAGVATDTNEPFVQIRANGPASDGELEIVLLGQVTPEVARALAMSYVEAACAAEHDALLVGLMMRRLDGDPAAGSKAAAILQDLRHYREENTG